MYTQSPVNGGYRGSESFCLQRSSLSINERPCKVSSFLSCHSHNDLYSKTDVREEGLLHVNVFLYKWTL